jgi:hypothetical protein
VARFEAYNRIVRTSSSRGSVSLAIDHLQVCPLVRTVSRVAMVRSGPGRS